MCGILGQLAYRAGAPGVETITPLVAGMQRRGPDAQGIWSDGGRAIFGFRRLAVLDPSSRGDQPMCSADERYVLVFNGEVYNFRELRSQLESKGVCFRSSGDTEVLLQALIFWGAEALTRLNGMFALGFYDRSTARLLLARDHAGIKPLYYLAVPAGFFFASQYDQILAHPWRRGLGLSPDGLGSYLRLGYIPAPHAALEHTHMLAPGSWLEVDGEGTLRHGRWFDFEAFREPDLHGEEANEAVAAAVQAAVERQLVSDVPVGAFLSGGIDSPLVAATMSSLRNEAVPSFTLGVPGDPADESKEAGIYAREIGTKHRVRNLGPELVPGLVEDSVAACGEPLADATHPVLALSQLAREHVTVMLSGDGGDELFWGYAQRLAAALGQVDWFRGDAQGTPLQRMAAACRGSEGGLPRTVGESYRMTHSQGMEPWLHNLFPELPPLPAEPALFDYDGRDLDRTAQWLRWSEFTGNLQKMLLKVDRASMFHSLEVRVPLLDREVVEIAQRVDWKSCLDPEQKLGKQPLRRALARHLHRQTRPKRGFTVPMGEWLRGPLRSRVEESLLSRSELLGLPMKTSAMERLWKLHDSRRGEFGWPIWSLLNLVLWQERHLG